MDRLNRSADEKTRLSPINHKQLSKYKLAENSVSSIQKLEPLGEKTTKLGPRGIYNLTIPNSPKISENLYKMKARRQKKAISIV